MGSPTILYGSGSFEQDSKLLYVWSGSGRVGGWVGTLAEHAFKHVLYFAGHVIFTVGVFPQHRLSHEHGADSV